MRPGHVPGTEEGWKRERHQPGEDLDLALAPAVERETPEGGNEGGGED